MRAVLLRRPVLGWALYDWGNSAFATTVMAGFLPVFFKQYWSAGVPPTVSTFRLGLAHAAGGLLIALMVPFLGAMADRGGLRLRLLLLFTLLGTATTAAMYLVPQGEWVLAMVLYGFAGIGFAGGVTFCDALLMDVADPPEYDLVSAWGYSLGYVGGGALFALNVLMTLDPGRFGLASAAEAVRLSFVLVAVWWLAFTVPALLWVRERGPARAMPPLAAMRAGMRELAGTVRAIRSYRPLVWFLIAYWLYIDGVNTIIKMAVDFGLSLGFRQQSLMVALLLTQFVAFPAALAFGWIGARIGARNGIFIAIGVYSVTTIAAYFMDSVSDFYLLAVAIGLVQGGIQSLSRSLFAALHPGRQAGRVLRLLQHDEQVRHRSRPAAGRQCRAPDRQLACRDPVGARAVCCRSAAAVAFATGTLPGGGVEPVAGDEAAVEIRVPVGQFARLLEEGFADDREELHRVLGAVGIEERFLAPIQSCAQAGKLAFQQCLPLPPSGGTREPRCAVAARRVAIEIVREFVDHDVERFSTATGVLHVFPGQQDAADVPGLSGEHALILGDDAVFILPAVWHDEL